MTPIFMVLVLMAYLLPDTQNRHLMNLLSACLNI